MLVGRSRRDGSSFDIRGVTRLAIHAGSPWHFRHFQQSEIDVLKLEVHGVGQTADGEPRHLSLRGVSRSALPALQPFVGPRLLDAVVRAE